MVDENQILVMPINDADAQVRQLGAFIGRLLALRDFHRVAWCSAKCATNLFSHLALRLYPLDELAPPYRQNDE